MADKNNLGSPQTVTDDQIVTERRLPRRSFLSATGAVLTGAVAIVSGLRAAPQADPDQKKASDPDQKKASDPDQKKASKKKSRKKKASDPDKVSDPDKAK